MDFSVFSLHWKAVRLFPNSIPSSARKVLKKYLFRLHLKLLLKKIDMFVFALSMFSRYYYHRSITKINTMNLQKFYLILLTIYKLFPYNVLHENFPIFQIKNLKNWRFMKKIKIFKFSINSNFGKLEYFGLKLYICLLGLIW